MIDKAPQYGGAIIAAAADCAYAASMIPDEDEMKSTPVRLGRLSDPDGYAVEVVQVKNPGAAPRLAKIVLKVLDLNDSIAFYEGLGLKLLRKRSNGNSSRGLFITNETRNDCCL